MRAQIFERTNMLLRQTTTRGRHNLLTTVRLSQRRHGVASSRSAMSFISTPAIVSSCSLLQQQQRQYARQSYDYTNSMNQAALMTAAVISAGLGTAVATSTNDDDSAALKFSQFYRNNRICNCEEAPIKESKTKLTATSSLQNEEEEEDDEQDNLPTYTLSQVSNYNGQVSPTNPHQRIWMSYGGLVYDVTEFVANHPGGSEKILMGAGGAIEPYWYCELLMLNPYSTYIHHHHTNFYYFFVIMPFFIHHSVPTTLCLPPTTQPPLQNAHW